ncbi:shikimate kinase [Methanococcoides vulcani]|uniref:Shikimate kinase n=1 Tax=Methanococcoides vulcani TaxID=1353158 RepID=A0A1I0BP49_9EURY|nr:shikimate kinase [Methanococcoides vulcani]SET08055.1 shikimate kinase [Methanococcoides vulcani]
MTLTGHAYALGAGTIINAIATWKGSAFGVDLKTFADVELTNNSSSITGSIENVPQGDTTLIERSVELVLEHFGIEMGGTVLTRTEVPLASGLKSSSAAANATILATLDAIGETMEPMDAVHIGVRAAKDTGVTITGALDDACASFFGGIVVADNRKNELIKRTEKEMDVIIFAPDRQAFSSQTNVQNSELIAPWIDMAYELALEGEYEKAMTLNGFLYCGALGFSTDIMMEALRIGVKGVSLSGTGPAYSALVDKDLANELVNIWEECGTTGKVINTKINNEGSMKL